MTVLLALAWSGTALASDSGLVDQYTEQVPTASGSTGTGHGGGGTSYTTPLSSSVKAKVHRHGGKDAKTLEKLATSSRYGAPVRPGLESGVLGAGSPGALSAAASAVTDGTDARLVALLAVLLATAAVMLAVAAGRRGRRPGF